jgi:hypothetical protein
MTEDEINTLENKAFRLECEILRWRMFRTAVKQLIEGKIVFGDNTNEELQNVKEQLESIKYY